MRARGWARIVAYVYLALAGALIMLGYGWSLYSRGWWALADMLGPSNIANYVAVLLTLAPGLLLLAWATKPTR